MPANARIPLFVGGLPSTWTHKQIWELLAAFGGLNAVLVITDGELGKSRGFGFASISNSGALSAIEVLDGAIVAGRTISVKVARETSIYRSKFQDLEELSVDESPERVVSMAEDVGRLLVAKMRDDPSRIHDLQHRNFELLIAELLRSHGYDVTVTPPSKDGGYDLFITATDAMGISNVWAVECKHYAPGKPVGVELVNGLFGVPKVRCDGANPMLVTSSTFTAGALDLRMSTHNLELKGIDDIRDWIATYGRSSDNGKILIAPNGHLVGCRGRSQT